MINLKQGCLFALSLTALLSVNTAFSFAPLNAKPFLSADIGYRDLDFQDDQGGNVFKSSLPQSSVQVGLRFWDFFGFQFGYERTRREGKTARIGPNEIVLGRHIPANGSEHHSTESGLQGQYFDLLAFVPTHPMTHLEFVFGLGIMRSKLLHNDLVVGRNDDTLLAPESRTFRQKKTHTRVLGGIQKLFDVHQNRFIKQAGLRALVTWENTSQHKSQPPLEIQDSFATAQNSYVFSLGVIVSG